MNQLLLDYLPLAVFLGVALLIGGALMVAPFLVAVRNPDPEKMSAYECGFNAFDDARMKFDVRFYLVSILFIIFDLEVAFLFPVGGRLQAGRRFRLLVDDGVSRRADRRLCLRVEKGRWNGIDDRAKPSAALAQRRERGSFGPTIAVLHATSPTSSPTRASW